MVFSCDTKVRIKAGIGQDIYKRIDELQVGDWLYNEEDVPVMCLSVSNAELYDLRKVEYKHHESNKLKSSFKCSPDHALTSYAFYTSIIPTKAKAVTWFTRCKRKYLRTEMGEIYLDQIIAKLHHDIKNSIGNPTLKIMLMQLDDIIHNHFGNNYLTGNNYSDCIRNFLCTHRRDESLDRMKELEGEGEEIEDEDEIEDEANVEGEGVKSVKVEDYLRELDLNDKLNEGNKLDLTDNDNDHQEGSGTLKRKRESDLEEVSNDNDYQEGSGTLKRKRESDLEEFGNDNNDKDEEDLDKIVENFLQENNLTLSYEERHVRKSLYKSTNRFFEEIRDGVEMVKEIPEASDVDQLYSLYKTFLSEGDVSVPQESEERQFTLFKRLFIPRLELIRQYVSHRDCTTINCNGFRRIQQTLYESIHAEFVEWMLKHEAHYVHVDPLMVKQGDELFITVEEFQKYTHYPNGWEVIKIIRCPYKSQVSGIKRDQLPIDPFYFGLWSGDGSVHSGGIASSDDETKVWLDMYALKLNANLPPGAAEFRVKSYLSSKAGDFDEKRGIRATKNCYEHQIATRKDDPRPRYKNPITTGLREFGLLNNKTKRIPPIYMEADLESRLALLAGAMESDGWIDKQSGQYGFAQNNENHRKLMFDLKKLAASCGIKSTAIRKYTVKRSKLYKDPSGPDIER